MGYRGDIKSVCNERKTMVKLKFFLDIDNVIAKTGPAWLSEFNSQYNTSFTQADVSWSLVELTACGISHKKVYEEFHDFLASPEVIMSLETHPHSIKTIKKLMKDHEIIYLSSRAQEPHEIHFSKKDWKTIEEYTIKWLKKHEIYDNNLILNSKKEEIIKEHGGGIFLEDGIHQIGNVLKGARDTFCFIFDQPYNRFLPFKEMKVMIEVMKRNNNHVCRIGVADPHWKDFYSKLKFYKLLE